MTIAQFTARHRPVHGWTRWYWPLALVVSLLAFFVPYLSGHYWSTGAGFLVGAAAILGPELACVFTRNFQDTFSDWVWSVDSIPGSLPIRAWNAKHFLTMIGYLVITGCLNQWLCGRGFTHVYLAEDIASAGGSVWLLYHFFFHWWA